MKRRDLLAMAALPTLAGTARAQIGGAPIRILVCAPAGGSIDIPGWGKAVKFSGARPE